METTILALTHGEITTILDALQTRLFALMDTGCRDEWYTEEIERVKNSINRFSKVYSDTLPNYPEQTICHSDERSIFRAMQG